MRKEYTFNCRFDNSHPPMMVKAESADILKWRKGDLIQNALPYLTEDEREIMISGMCPICWKETFEVPE